MKNLKIILFIFTILFVIPFVLPAANYGAGAYGAGVYGQASCGDAVCESGETCSSCSSDCGVCASTSSTPQVYGVIINYTFIEKIRSWDLISQGGTVIMTDFEEDYGINSIRLVVGEEATQAQITVRKYHAKPADVFVEAPGIVYKYLEIETENFETLEKATVNIEVLKSWASGNSVETENVSMYKFSESSKEWRKLDTYFVRENEEDYFYETVLNSFSFFAISGESLVPPVPGADLIPEETEVSGIGDLLSYFGGFNLLWIVIFVFALASICLLIVIIIIAKEDKDIQFLKSKQRYDYLTRPS